MTDEGPTYDEASVTVNGYAMDTPEAAARALIDWIKEEDGPIYVQVKDVDGRETQVVVRSDNGQVAYAAEVVRDNRAGPVRVDGPRTVEKEGP
jgi:hypothetical protein